MDEPVVDWIHLEQISFPCMLGLLEWEQRQVQTLNLQVHMNLDLDGASGGELSASVNYAETLEDLQFIAQHGRWRLLESMAAAMARQILAPPSPGEARAQVAQVRLRISKPEVFGGRAVPSVEILRSSAWGHPAFVALPDQPGVRVAPLQVTPDAGAYRIELQPLAEWKIPAGMALRVLAGEPHAGACQGPVPFRAGAALARGSHRVLNAGSQPCLLLGLSQPPMSLPNE